jgi:hypothetical protein
METQEYFSLAEKLDSQLRQDQHQFELYSYMTVWLKSRMPSLYDELEADFRRIEPNVYAVQAAKDRRYDHPF